MISNKLQILLIEDSPDDAELTIRTLKKNNICNEIIHLHDGEQALEYIFNNLINANEASHTKVILLDIKMPKVDGIQVLEKLKSDERTKKIPVVILTSSRESPDILRCYELGVNSYIVKPVGFEAFTKAIVELGYYWTAHNQTSI